MPEDVADRLAAVGLCSPRAIDRGGVLMRELADRVEAQLAVIAIDRFLAAGREWHDRLDRRAVVELARLVSDLERGPVVWPGWQPDAATVRRRVLRDLEMALIRMIAARRVTAATAATVGLCEAGAASGELAQVTPEDVRTRADGSPEAVWLPGGGRAGYARERPLPAWVRPLIARRLQAAAGEPLGRLAYAGAAVWAHKQQSAVLMNLNTVLRNAGLGGDPTVKPLSVRNTAARAIYDRDGLEPAAAAVGAGSYDAVACEIGLKAHPPVRRR